MPLRINGVLMRASAGTRLIYICAAGALAAVAVDSLIPTPWAFRLGLNWLVEHFIAYFTVTALVCIAWPRPLAAAASLMALAGTLEALQGLTLDRTPDLLTAMSGSAGVISAASLAWLVLYVWKTWANPSSR